ncbi:MAG: metal ABC transporter permease [Candidatus Liptonbacteria bacterium]|nr:metal ABC transporter permease [Candidatus Liptonbacteria bacterium]
MDISFNIYSLILASGVAAVAGVVGSFAVMKKMSLAGDVVSHIALPGIGIALLLKVNPLIGAAATLILGTLLIWQLEKKSSLSTDTAIGVAFTASIALGVLLTPNEDLLEILFGSFSSTNPFSFLAVLALTIGVAVVIFALRHRLILSIFSPELAAATGVNVSQTNLIYFLLFALTLFLGLQFLGTVLVGAILIAPAAASRQVSSSLNSFLLLSALFGVFSVVAGSIIASIYSLALGPAIVCVAAVIFGLSLFVKRK